MKPLGQKHDKHAYALGENGHRDKAMSDAAKGRARREEREAIVEWLKTTPFVTGWCLRIAHAIEQGEHTKPHKNDGESEK